MPVVDPVESDVVDVAGIEIPWRVFGAGEPTLLLLPTFTIVSSEIWKGQVPYLSRHFRVVTYDAPGNGGATLSSDPSDYAPERQTDYALAVLDATETDETVTVGLSVGTRRQLRLTAHHPDRVFGQVMCAPSVRLVPNPARESYPFRERLNTTEGWAKFNEHFIREHYDEFVEFFNRVVCPEPFSSKFIEDAVAFGAGSTPDAVVAMLLGEHQGYAREDIEAWASAVRCPSLILHGDQDEVSVVDNAYRLAELLGGEVDLVVMEGVGHAVPRHPMQVNIEIREAVERWARPAKIRRVWRRGLSRRRRALYLSSPIGLGHVRRDLTVARGLRERHPDLQLDWLAQPPVAGVLEEAGETVHPASSELVSEAAVIDQAAGEHDLQAFRTLRGMSDELLANFGVFHDAVESDDFDLVIADEGWEIDFFLHEHPELKRYAYAWFTDFVGVVPVEHSGSGEHELIQEYNEQMLAHVGRHPRLRDRALYVGDPEDLLEVPLGEGLPTIRDWTEPRYVFPGYIHGLDLDALADHEARRDEVGFRDDEQVVLVAVGGSGVGAPLLRRIVGALPQLRRAVDGLRLVVVTGPRIDPSSLPEAPDLDVHGYVPGLWRWLAACDVAIVQGGLTTTMELAAARRPFVYVPLRRHFEQQHHVHHRLQRHGVGHRLDYDDLDPDRLAAEVTAALATAPPAPVLRPDAGRRAADLIAELI